MKLAEALAAVPLDHPILVKCFERESLCDDDNLDLDPCDHDYEERQRDQFELFCRYGFDGPVDGDAIEFLSRYQEVLERQIERRRDRLAGVRAS